MSKIIGLTFDEKKRGGRGKPPEDKKPEDKTPQKPENTQNAEDKQ